MTCLTAEVWIKYYGVSLNHRTVCFCSGEALALPRVQCPNHPEAILVEDYRAGDMICPECGLVVGETIKYSHL